MLTLGLWAFQGQPGTNVPGLLAAVTLVVPIFVLYLIGRRYLPGGLTAGFGKVGATVAPHRRRSCAPSATMHRTATRTRRTFR